MKDLFISVIRDRLADRFALHHSVISALKFSTPNSGKSPMNKVIFLFFKDQDSTPFVCAKTVRTQEANNIIERGFARLSAAYEMLQLSQFADLFPQPLLLSVDTNGCAFSLETACSGRRPAPRDYAGIAETYGRQQQFLFQQNSKFIENWPRFMEKLFLALELPAAEQQRLQTYYREHIAGRQPVRVPRLPQHGDLTLVNIVIGPQGVQIYDCDRFGLIDLAGFDLFQIIVRWSKADPSVSLLQAMGRHLKDLGQSQAFGADLIFAYCLYEFIMKREVMRGDISAQSIINRYNSLT